jgi:hypothetical protein
MGPSTPQQGFASPLTHGMPSLLKRTNGFFGAAASPNEPNMQYVRLAKEGIGMWFKGQVTEAFPPEDITFPWDIITYPDPDSQGPLANRPWKAKIVPGTIGGILPSNYDEELNVGTGLNYAVVNCTTNGESVTSATIQFTNSFPAPENASVDRAPSSFKTCFGMVDKQVDKSPTVFSFWKRSPSAVPNAAFVTQRSDPAQPHQFNYTWRVG